MKQLVSKVSYSRSYNEIFDYVRFAFPDKFQVMEEDKRIYSFVVKWENKYSINYQNLIQCPENQDRFLDEDDRNHICTNMAFTQVFNAISEEFQI